MQIVKGVIHFIIHMSLRSVIAHVIARALLLFARGNLPIDYVIARAPSQAPSARAGVFFARGNLPKHMSLRAAFLFFAARQSPVPSGSLLLAMTH